LLKTPIRLRLLGALLWQSLAIFRNLKRAKFTANFVDVVSSLLDFAFLFPGTLIGVSSIASDDGTKNRRVISKFVEEVLEIIRRSLASVDDRGPSPGEPLYKGNYWA
jgi:hypothetical protein